MTDVRVTLTDNSDRPNSQKEEHVAMNALFQSMAKGSQSTPNTSDDENTAMNQDLKAMAKANGCLR